jgi:elongation factor Ts
MPMKYQISFATVRRTYRYFVAVRWCSGAMVERNQKDTKSRPAHKSTVNEPPPVRGCSLLLLQLVPIIYIIHSFSLKDVSYIIIMVLLFHRLSIPTSVVQQRISLRPRLFPPHSNGWSVLSFHFYSTWRQPVTSTTISLSSSVIPQSHHHYRQHVVPSIQRLQQQPLKNTRSQSTTTTTSSSSSTNTVSISMDVLKDLRNRTGAPIVDCKKAIQEAQKMVATTTTSSAATAEMDLFPAALDWLRSHGAAKATTKVAGRTTTQGLVGIQISHDATTAAMVKVASETDFAALSTTFVQLVQTIVQTTLVRPSASSVSTTTVPLRETILQQPAVMIETDATSTTTTTTSTTIQDCLNDAIVSIRENISIADAIHLPKVTTSTTGNHDNRHSGMYVGYVHNKVDTPSNTIAVSAGTAAAIVLLVPTTVATTTTSETGTQSSSSPTPQQPPPKLPTREEIQQIGKLLAMHIVAAKPLYLSIADIPTDVIEKERDIIQQQLQNDPSHAKKPPHIVEMIVRGKLQKYYESVVLLEQPHMIVDTNPNIQSYLQQHQLSLQRYEYSSI